MMDFSDSWSLLTTVEQDTTVLIPTITSDGTGYWYEYSGEGVASAPTPPADPDLEIQTILSPVGTVASYSTVTPMVVRHNNAGSSTIAAAWMSMYIGDWYSDSRETGPLGPGQSDTVIFNDWQTLERKELDVSCVGGCVCDQDITNNSILSSVEVELSDFELMEILEPRGIVDIDDTVTPSAMIRNNGTTGSTVSVTMSFQNYTDTKNIFLGPDSCAELQFDDWTPSTSGACSTSCSITTMDQRQFNNTIIGEVYVVDNTEIGEASLMPAVTMIHSPVPNPFSHFTTLSFQLAASGDVTLDIYDLSGRMVRTLAEGNLAAGEHSFELDGTGLTSGVYFARLEDSSGQFIKKLVLIR
jgi:hypothetical protein